MAPPKAKPRRAKSGSVTKTGVKTGKRPGAQGKVVKPPAVALVDVVIPIVFPEYKARAHEDVKIPLINQKYEGKYSVGHAGVLMIRGVKGLTKYYEYGRYDPAEHGLVQHPETSKKPWKLPDVKYGTDGHPTRESLVLALKAISTNAGQGGPIAAVYIAVPGTFDTMLKYAIEREAQNKDPKRKGYELRSYNCMTFAADVVKKAGKPVPDSAVDMPRTYMFQMSRLYPELLFDPRKNVLTVKTTKTGPDVVLPSWGETVDPWWKVW